jgi:hypothetical protein
MTNLVRRHVMSESSGLRLAWSAGFALLATCTALVLKTLPEFGVAASIGLVSAVAFAWVVVGSQLPRALRAR